jgi:hypothetical protein
MRWVAARFGVTVGGGVFVGVDVGVGGTVFVAVGWGVFVSVGAGGGAKVEQADNRRMHTNNGTATRDDPFLSCINPPWKRCTTNSHNRRFRSTGLVTNVICLS